ncbi:MAG TPA: DNA cytosine methyltransferase [Cerasibacillus sp.]|uniref:DNA cytosine methyltransferase n=1 Tax=Cerasibacillus sp. TaxID=2498711 RepID=UPI002F422648
MNVIDLFAGAGGLSEGFRQEGFNILAHVEMDKNACNTLRTREAYYYLKENNKIDLYKKYILNKVNREQLYKSVPEEILSKVIESEINDETIDSIFSEIDKLIGDKTVDFIIGGPPCQAYSTAGISRDPNRMKCDPRNYLYLYYIEFLKEYKPKFFVFENVKGILTAKKGEIFEGLKGNLDKAGYKMDYKILNSKDFGVAQSRERVIIIGWRKDIEFSYPKFLDESNPPTINELFKDLPKINAGESLNGIGKYIDTPSKALKNIRDDKWDILTYHVARPNNKNDLNIYKLVVETWNKEGKMLKYNELPEHLITHKNSKSFLDRYKIVRADSQSHTVVAHISKDGHYYIHPDIEQNRSLSVREAARIQSFPDDFYFESSRTAAFQQIGNAVPPLMARIIAKKIKEAF